ncbi:MAG: radical SAM protein [Candidatus Aenigmatarchaeota archaeon]
MNNDVIVTGREIKKLFKKYPLVRLAISVTNCCNLRCIHCSQNAGNALKEEYSISDLKQIIKDTCDEGLCTVGITGGEPTIRKDLLSIMRYADRKDISLVLNTNGTLITRKMAKDISKLSNLRIVAVSLDGSNPKTHDNIRGVSRAFSRTIKGIKNLVSEGVEVTLAYTIMNRNKGEIEDLIKLAKKLKVSIVRFLFMENFGRAKTNSEEIVPYLERRNIIARINRLYKKYKKNLTIWVYAPPSLLPKFLRDSMPYTAGCLPGVTICDLLADGTMYPCLGLVDFPEMKIGNVLDKNILKLWNGSKVLTQFRKVTPQKLKGVCRDCYFLLNCMGHCRAAAYTFGGSIFAPNPWCQEYFDNNKFPKKYYKKGRLKIRDRKTS